MKLVAAAALLGLAFGAQAQDAKMVMEEFMIPSGDPGISLYVRNKHPEGMSRVRSERIVLYVNGATVPAGSAFARQLGGFPGMDAIATRGYDVHLVETRGYGKSTRPPEMDKPAAE